MIAPKRGWTRIDSVDLLDRRKPCDACGKPSRNLHTLAHPEAPHSQVCGVCARGMERDAVTLDQHLAGLDWLRCCVWGTSFVTSGVTVKVRPSMFPGLTCAPVVDGVLGSWVKNPKDLQDQIKEMLGGVV